MADAAVAVAQWSVLDVESGQEYISSQGRGLKFRILSYCMNNSL